MPIFNYVHFAFLIRRQNRWWRHTAKESVHSYNLLRDASKFLCSEPNPSSTESSTSLSVKYQWSRGNHRAGLSWNQFSWCVHDVYISLTVGLFLLILRQILVQVPMGDLISCLLSCKENLNYLCRINFNSEPLLGKISHHILCPSNNNSCSLWHKSQREIDKSCLDNFQHHWKVEAETDRNLGSAFNSKSH